MCFSGRCKYERSDGECGKEKGQICPGIDGDELEEEKEEEEKEEDEIIIACPECDTPDGVLSYSSGGWSVYHGFLWWRRRVWIECPVCKGKGEVRLSAKHGIRPLR